MNEKKKGVEFFDPYKGSKATIGNFKEMLKYRRQIFEVDKLFEQTESANKHFKDDKRRLLRQGKKPRLFTAADTEEIISKNNEGAKNKELAKEYECSVSIIKTIIAGKYLTDNKPVSNNYSNYRLYSFYDSEKKYIIMTKYLYRYYVELITRINKNESEKPNRNVTRVHENHHGIGNGKYYRRTNESGKYPEKDIGKDEFIKDMKDMILRYALRCEEPEKVYIVKSGAGSKQNLFGAAKCNEIKALYAQGYTYEEIYKRFNCSWETVQKICTDKYENQKELRKTKNKAK